MNGGEGMFWGMSWSVTSGLVSRLQMVFCPHFDMKGKTASDIATLECFSLWQAKTSPHNTSGLSEDKENYTTHDPQWELYLGWTCLVINFWFKKQHQKEGKRGTEPLHGCSQHVLCVCGCDVCCLRLLLQTVCVSVCELKLVETRRRHCNMNREQTS